ncbi:MAG: Trm112 family protein [Candidatus Riflebacteria bacterium]|nr:Trm112 family protein [Candidatus Riflebacteria bacterium]
MLDAKLLEVLACPKCKGDLDYKPEKNELRCNACKLIYAVKDDIPIMLIEEAKPFDQAGA